MNASLDTQRKKKSDSDLEVADPNNIQQKVGQLVFGLIATVYGVMIYYFMPLAMLSFNFSMILKVFLFILNGLLLGLSMLTYNLQHALEVVFTEIFIVFEDRAMKRLVRSNLKAHRDRNKLTSLIYSISLGFIIFLIVSYNVQIESLKLDQIKEYGSYF